MAYKAIPLETRSCKGCGVEFETTDPRKWFHKAGCGYARRIKWTNEWLLVNRPNYPTEPCLACGAPVVQYRTRRYDGESRYCDHKCAPQNKRPLAKAQWPPRQYGSCSRLSKGCSECKTGRQAGLCGEHHRRRFVLRQMLWTRLRWLLPRVCSQCDTTSQAWGHLRQFCTPCSSHNRSAQRKWMKIKRKHRMTGGATDISPARLYERDDRMCALCHRVTDHPRVWEQWMTSKRWMPNAPTVDHIVPLAKGGTHTWENVQLAHWSCNGDKGDTIVTVAPKIITTFPATVPSDEFVNLL